MNRHLIRLAGPLAGLILAAAVGVGPVLASSASAAGSSAAASVSGVDDLHPTRCADAWRKAIANPSVETYKAVGLCEIDRRLATIDRLGNAVDGSRALTDAHQAALEAILDNSAAGLRALRAEIESDTTIAELRTDIGAIFKDYRIYALVTRQVWLVVGADAVSAAGAKLQETAADLATLIERAEAAGQDVTEAKAHLGAMNAAIAEAIGGVAGVADRVLPLTPADWNNGSAGPVLRTAHTAIAAARADLRTALSEARQVIAALA